MHIVAEKDLKKNSDVNRISFSFTSAMKITDKLNHFITFIILFHLFIIKIPGSISNIVHSKAVKKKRVNHLNDLCNNFHFEYIAITSLSSI